eukprot:1928388-Pyramimonas_sp.AAC.1
MRRIAKRASGVAGPCSQGSKIHNMYPMSLWLPPNVARFLLQVCHLLSKVRPSGPRRSAFGLDPPI